MSIQVRRPDGPNWAHFGTASKPGSPLPRAPISPQTGSPPYMLGSLGQRSVAVQAAPMPWTRFFFPEELGAESTGGLNPLFRHFDVRTTTDLSAEELALAHDPPSWMPEAYQRLSFVQMRGIGDENTVARDITQGGLKLMRQGGEEHLAQVNRFCRVVARFRPRTWSDTEPLINLLSGVVLYLLGQLSNAADVAALKLKAEYDLKFKNMQDAEASKYSRMLQKEQGFIRLNYEQRLQNVKEEAGQKASEELGALIRNTQLAAVKAKEESTGLQKKLDETLELLFNSHAQGETLTAQLTEEKRSRAEYNKKVMQEQEDLKQHVTRLTGQVGAARKTAVAAVHTAATEEEVWQHCAHALQQLTSANHAYCAKLLEVEEWETAPSAATAPEMAKGTDCKGQDRAEQEETADAGEAGASAIHADLRGSTHQFKYVAAGGGAEFMIGQVLQQHQGVSWALLDRETQSMVIRDLSIDSNVHFFRRSVSGMYTAAAVRNQDGSLGGMLCCDGPQPADAVEQGTDQQFAVQLAQAAATTLAALAQHKQEMLEAAALHMAEESVSEGVILEELERHADLIGGRALLADASRELFMLKQVDIDKLTFLSDCSTSAWAIIRAGVTLVSDEPLDLGSWSQLKQLLTLDFMSLVGKFNADGLGARWPHIRQVLSATLNMTEAEVVGQGPLVQALMKFLMGLKNVSAGLALEHMLQVLKAVLFCLGQSANDTDTWGQCRGLVNRGMIKKMLQLKPKTMPLAKIREVRAVIKGLTEECVQNESMAALLLYKWLAVVLKVALTQQAKKYEEATNNA